jgi:hypothetical protein
MNVTINININMDNDAFGTNSTDRAEEVKRILKVAMNKFEGSDDIILRDYNGNKVGTLTVTEWKSS